MNSASAIICWRNKILLFHRDNIETIPAPDCWQIPGGGIEKGETPLQGLKRELNEEVSYCPNNIKFLGKLKRLDGHTSYIYESYVGDGEAKLFKHGVGEGQEIKFFTINEMGNLKLTPELGKIIKYQKTEMIEALKNKNFNKVFAKLKSQVL